ncbi:SMC-Scp complex subunit ScpB [Eubacteriales bacterium OttesenSCG-928-N14]|nr:SMC-Scp complex subunit ScpB [Eubacteriales bacterium OttesenSCG-928-N14]
MSAQQKAAIEAILFVSGEAVPLENIAQALEITVLEVDSLISDLTREMHEQNRGIELIRLEDSVQLRTNADYSEQVQKALKPLTEKTLSRSVLETLSIIAYKQPITRAEIEGIKGVSADYSVQALLQLKLIEPLGRKDVLGRPMLYGTSEGFLRHFGISSLSELPPLPEDGGDVEMNLDSITV